MTVPINGYVAADKCAGRRRRPDPELPADPVQGVGGAEGRAVHDHARPQRRKVYQDEFVAFLEGKYPESRTDAHRTIFYDLDNEPDLWSSTHPRIHPDPLTYQELIDKTIDYGEAIKAVAPMAKVFGFVSYGWNGYATLQDAPDAGGRDFIDTLLDALAAREAQTGTRPVDVLDLHWYPEATGGGQRITSTTRRPTSPRPGSRRRGRCGTRTTPRRRGSRSTRPWARSSSSRG